MRSIIIIFILCMYASSISAIEQDKKNKPVMEETDEDVQNIDGRIEKDEMKFSIGALTYYSWWNPVWKHEKGMNAVSEFIYSDTKTAKSGVYYGPLLSLKLSGKWSLSTTFIYGNYNFNYYGINTIIFTGYFFPLPAKRSISKYDCDFLANRVLGKYSTFFFGLKFQGYSIEEKRLMAVRTFITSGDLFFVPSRDRIGFYSGGLGAGFGFHIPVVGNFYLLPSLSVQSMAGAFKGGLEYNSSKIAVSAGGNAIMSLGYQISAINLMVTAGGRFQYLYYFKKPNPNYMQSNDYFYGLNFSVVYQF